MHDAAPVPCRSAGQYPWCRGPCLFTMSCFFPIIISMKLMLMRLLLFLVALSLVLQNTCPYGFAEETAFARPLLHRCLLHYHQAMEQETVDDHSSTGVHQGFVMAASYMRPSGRYFPLSTDGWPVVSDRYTSPFKEPLIRPPAFGRFSAGRFLFHYGCELLFTEGNSGGFK